MTDAAWIVLVVTAVFAVGNWVSRATDNAALEYVTKPATTIGLIGFAATVDAVDPTVQRWFVVALACGLAGDMFLMSPDKERFFPFGLAAFLVGHCFYVAGFVAGGIDTGDALVGLAVCAIGIAVLGVRIVVASRKTDRLLPIAVGAYILVISAMVVAAFGSASGVAIAGALIFYASDSLIGWSTFVKDLGRWGSVAIMVTYHVGQGLLVASLV